MWRIHANNDAEVRLEEESIVASLTTVMGIFPWLHRIYGTVWARCPKIIWWIAVKLRLVKTLILVNKKNVALKVIRVKSTFYSMFTYENYFNFWCQIGKDIL